MQTQNTLRPAEPPYDADTENILAGYPRQGDYLLKLVDWSEDWARSLEGPPS